MFKRKNKSKNIKYMKTKIEKLKTEKALRSEEKKLKSEIRHLKYDDKIELAKKIVKNVKAVGKGFNNPKLQEKIYNYDMLGNKKGKKMKIW